MKQIKCFWVVSSLHSYIVVFRHWKILQKTIYFTGVPIESEANKVFLSGAGSTFIHCGIQPLEKHFRKPFTLRLCLWEKSEVKCLDENK